MPVSIAFLNDNLIIKTCRGKRTLSCSRWQSRRRRVKNWSSQLSRYALLQWDDWLVQVWHLSCSLCLSFHKTEHTHHSLWQQQHPHADVYQQKSANWCLHYTRSQIWEVLDNCCSPRLQPRSRQLTHVLLENGIKKPHSYPYQQSHVPKLSSAMRCLQNCIQSLAVMCTCGR